MVAANVLFCRKALKQASVISNKTLQELGCGFVKTDKLAVALQKRLAEEAGQQKIRLSPR